MAKYPALRVGQRWTADLASSMLPDYAYKVGTTARISTTTRTSDPDLQLSVAADALYELHLSAQFTSAAAADISIGFSGPSGAGMQWEIASLELSATGFTGDLTGAYALGSAVTVAGLSPTGTPIVISGFLDTASTAGTLAFQWAQGTSTASNTTALSGSWMKLTRIA